MQLFLLYPIPLMMKSFPVPEELSGKRLDRIVLQFLGTESRAIIQKGIRAGYVRVNGAVQKPHYAAKAGDMVDIDDAAFRILAHPMLQPRDLHLPILFENEDFCIVNKPAGILTHPAANNFGPSVAEFLLFRYPDVAAVGEHSLRPGIVHRLDKDTSGVLVAARNASAYAQLKHLFQLRQITKTYQALCCGVPHPHNGIIETLIGRSSRDPRRRTTDVALARNPKSAHSHYRVAQTFGSAASFLELHPKTGRMHQIRVHLQHIGVPILGDPLYGTKQSSALSRTLGISRQMLHASDLAFTLNAIPYAFHVPLPDDFLYAMRELKGLAAPKTPAGNLD